MLTFKEKLESFGYRLHPHSYHYPERYKKSLIQLKDGSIWSILEEDKNVTKNWKKSHALFIKPTYSCFWPDFLISCNYVPHNLNKNAVVAVYLKQIENNALSIESIDAATNSILLNDRAIWNIDDRADLSTWKAGQGIIVGVNNRWRCIQYPQILINADLYGHPHVSAIFFNDQDL